MPPILNDVRLKIVRLKSLGMGYKKIVNKVKEEDNIQLSLTGVKKVWKKFNETGDVGNRPRFEGTRNPQAKLGTQEHEDFVNTCMREIPDLSAKQLTKKLLEEFGIEICFQN